MIKRKCNVAKLYQSKSFFGFMVLVILLCLFIAVQPLQEEFDTTNVGDELQNIEWDGKGVEVGFVRNIDGDTSVFTLEGKEIKCRFLSIDTPETVNPNTNEHHLGKQASDYTKERLTLAKQIYIEYDNKSDHEDKYGRTLAWVWVDGTLLQEDLIKLGYAKTSYMYGNYKYNDRLLTFEEKAKEEKAGVWKEGD